LEMPACEAGDARGRIGPERPHCFYPRTLSRR